MEASWDSADQGAQPGTSLAVQQSTPVASPSTQSGSAATITSPQNQSNAVTLSNSGSAGYGYEPGYRTGYGSGYGNGYYGSSY
eukprot:CAMPEP_0114493032 /NCGR_PEP_ID=MMETSP0109-20121206/3889_1 /TAXON_ID=29199 /ORGANISM="Chlorarachnion reptans, Strain CCCM449" /LENGTH=82 /DNA_ID=CAMNT_0001669949 /DNA_START=74 /DNA_END=319 /DNA_ORIENTATION=-